MIRSKSNKFNKTLYILYPGDYFATSEDCILGSVTGSCLAVCLYDPKRGIGGMGHFILPGSVGTAGIIVDVIARRGIVHMEYLMGEIVKLGGDRHDLKAKIFGAGYLDTGSKKAAEFFDGNIRFIHEYFVLENIRVERSDLGGSFRRKIYFTVKDGTVYRQMLKNNEDSSEFFQLEREYVDSEFRNKEKTGKILLFE